MAGTAVNAEPKTGDVGSINFDLAGAETGSAVARALQVLKKALPTDDAGRIISKTQLSTQYPGFAKALAGLRADPRFLSKIQTSQHEAIMEHLNSWAESIAAQAKLGKAAAKRQDKFKAVLEGLHEQEIISTAELNTLRAVRPPEASSESPNTQSRRERPRVVVGLAEPNNHGIPARKNGNSMATGIRAAATRA